MWLRVANRKIHGTVSTLRVLVTSILVSILDVSLNTAIAIFTGSAVMLVEALASFADLVSVTMLALGFKSSRRRANKKHPFGYGKEVYFWAILSAFIIVAITATLSIWFGYQRLVTPSPVENILIAYVVLSVGVLTNAYAFWVGATKILDGRPFRELPKIFFNSPSVTSKTTVVVDGMGTVAALVGLSGLISLGITGNNQLDGVGAIMMGLVLAAFSVLLLTSLRSLVTGQSAGAELQDKIRLAAQKVPEVKEVLSVDTMMLGAESLLVNIEINLRNGLTTDQVEKIIKEVKHEIKTLQPGMHVHVEPDAS